MARVALLDVNVLVALFLPEHVHHDVAHDWFADERRHGWATCPTTENGFIRVAAQLRSDDASTRPDLLIDHLRRFCASGHHEKWTDVVSLSDEALFAPQFIRGPRQITDVYLLGLAKRKGGRLVTFDRTIPLKAVKGSSTGLLEVIAPVDPSGF